METNTDTTVERAQAGDLEAFRTLVDRHSRAVFRLAFRITGREEDADDAVQETFLKAFKKLGSYDGRAEFGTWLYRLATNCTLDLLRRRKRLEGRSTPLDETAVGLLEQRDTPDPIRLMASREVRLHIERALDSLSAIERSAFVLRHFEGCSSAEIAEALQLHAGAARQAVFRAVRKLRVALEPLVRSES
jgi:RNA polymerase sigma-70 factor (ECF subfamily)